MQSNISHKSEAAAAAARAVQRPVHTIQSIEARAPRGPMLGPSLGEKVDKNKLNLTIIVTGSIFNDLS